MFESFNEIDPFCYNKGLGVFFNINIQIKINIMVYIEFNH